MTADPHLLALPAALHESAIGTWTWVSDGDAFQASSVAAEIHGFTDGTLPPTLSGYLDLVHEDDRPGVDAMLRSVLLTNTAASAEYRIHTAAGALRWIQCSAAAASRETVALTGIFIDATPRRHRERELAVQQSVARLVAEAPGLEQVGVPLLSSLGTTLGWDYGELWLLRDSAEALTLIDCWSRDEAVARRFEQASREFSFTRGFGLPGQAWERGEVVWERDLATRSDLPRAALAAEAGLHAAVAFPIRISGDIRGVVVFYASAVEERDDQLTNMLGFVSLQLGQALERQATLTALQASEARYRALAETAPDAIITLDERGRIVYANKSTERIFGHALEDVMGQPLGLLMPARFRELHNIGFDRYIKTGLKQIPWSGVELPGLHKSGYEVSLEIAFGEFQHGPQTFITGVARDISSRVRDAEALRLIADASRALAESLDPEHIMNIVVELCIPRLADWCAVDLIDDQGVIRTAVLAHRDPAQADALRALLAQRPFPADAPAGPPQVLRTGTSDMRHVTEALLRGLAANEEQFRAISELGIVSYLSVPLAARGKVIGAMTLATAESKRRFDETDLSVAQEIAARVFFALENARLYSSAQELNRAKDQFFAQLSHELRTPITSVLGYARLIEQGELDADQIAEAIESIKASAHAQASLVEELLDVSRAITGKFNLNLVPIHLEVPVRAAVATVRPAAQARGIQLSMAEAESGCPVLGDENRLHQIAWNLLSNAIKFTPSGGSVTIRVFCEADGAVLEVTDTGQGIGPEFLPRVFDRFAQGSSAHSGGGLGLGLAIVQHLVELHGGTITAASDGPGLGSTFRVTLPVLDPASVSTDDE